MDGLGAAHIALIAFWGGVVAVESMVEALGERGHLELGTVARVHQATDRFIELPTLVGVVVTGLLLWARAEWAAELAPKVAFGAAAVTANLVTMVYVERRARGIGNARHATLMIFVFGGMLFPLAAVALFLGGRVAGWWG